MDMSAGAVCQKAEPFSVIGAGESYGSLSELRDSWHPTQIAGTPSSFILKRVLAQIVFLHTEKTKLSVWLYATYRMFDPGALPLMWSTTRYNWDEHKKYAKLFQKWRC